MSYGVDWTCRVCGWGNLDVRNQCRNCHAAKPAEEISAAEAFRKALPNSRPVSLADDPEAAIANGEAPARFSLWRALGFHEASPPFVDDIDGYAAGRLCVVTTIVLDWKDRLRLLISGKLQVATSIKTDVVVTRSRAQANTAVLPPERRS